MADRHEVGGEVEEQPYCCGMYELGSLYADTDKQMKEMLLDICPNTFCYGLFSNTSQYTSARRLAAMLRRYKLGKVIRIPDRRNPNTLAVLSMYVWMPDWKAMKRWAKRNGVDYDQNDYEF